MSTVYAGTDGSFQTELQLEKWREEHRETFIMRYNEIFIFRTGTDARDYVWYVPVEEDALPEGVEVDGITVRDTRPNE